MTRARLASGEPSVHNKTRYRMTWYLDGKRKDAYGATAREALENATAKVNEANAGARAGEAGTTSFAAFSEKFIEDCRVGRDGHTPLTNDTILSYESYLRTWINPALGTLMMSEITTNHVRTFRDALLQKTNSRATATRILTVTKLILRHAVVLEFISAVPGSEVIIQQDWGTDQEDKVDRIHSKEEMDRIEAAAKACFMSNEPNMAKAYRRWYPLFLILRTTGVRISESLALKWKDFGPGYCNVSISRSVSRPRKNFPQKDRTKRPKTKNAYRTIPIPAGVRRILEAWRKECMICPDDWVFPTRDGHALNYSNVRTKFWLPLMQRAEVDDLGMHSLRHYFISLLIREKRIKEASTLAGHASVAFTLDTYGHLIPGDEETMDMVANIVSGGMDF